jgi:PilZ domain
LSLAARPPTIARHQAENGSMAGRRDERFESNLTIKLEQGEGHLRNVSASGIYFVTNAQLALGELLRFTLDFAGEQIGLVTARCEARVVRVERVGGGTGVGAAFESIEFHRLGPPSP